MPSSVTALLATWKRKQWRPTPSVWRWDLTTSSILELLLSNRRCRVPTPGPPNLSWGGVLSHQPYRWPDRVSVCWHSETSGIFSGKLVLPNSQWHSQSVYDNQLLFLMCSTKIVEYFRILLKFSTKKIIFITFVNNKDFYPFYLLKFFNKENYFLLNFSSLRDEDKEAVLAVLFQLYRKTSVGESTSWVSTWLLYIKAWFLFVHLGIHDILSFWSFKWTLTKATRYDFDFVCGDSAPS